MEYSVCVKQSQPLGMLMKLFDYVKIKEAAEILGVTGNTLRNWEKTGKIKVYRWPHNNYRLYKKEDLEAILKEVEDSLKPVQG